MNVDFLLRMRTVKKIVIVFLQIQKEIIEMEVNIMNLTHAIENPISKPGALKMTETRLDNRLLRPGNELCRDMAQYSLIETDQTLLDVIAQLEHQLAMSHESLKGLDRKKLQLSQQLEVKTESLFIDETECMGMRQSISVQCY